MTALKNYKSQQSSSIYTQVTIEFRFRKSLAQERLKSNLEFRYQIIVSAIKLSKCFAKFMIPIAMFKKLTIFASVETSNITRRYSKTNELRGIDSIGCRARNITILNGKLIISKSKSSRLS